MTRACCHADSSAAVGLKDMLKQLEEAIAALELNPKT